MALLRFSIFLRMLPTRFPNPLDLATGGISTVSLKKFCKKPFAQTGKARRPDEGPTGEDSLDSFEVPGPLDHDHLAGG